MTKLSTSALRSQIRAINARLERLPRGKLRRKLLNRRCDLVIQYIKSLRNRARLAEHVTSLFRRLR